MKITLMGCGWYGMELASHLGAHEVLGTTTTIGKLGALKKLNVKPFLFSDHGPDAELLDADVIILNIPPFANMLQVLQNWNWPSRPWVIFISSTSAYGDKKNSHILLEQEAWVQHNFSQWTILRFAGLVGKDRHPGKYLSGKNNIAGKDWPVNLLHLDDAVGATLAVMENQIQHKIINIVCDEHRTKKEFYSEYAKQNNLPPPGFDESDNSVGKIVENTDLKRFYTLKHSKMTGKDF